MTFAKSICCLRRQKFSRFLELVYSVGVNLDSNIKSKKY